MPQEVTEEKHESLHVLELDRTPRPRKLAAERAYFDGAHEVRFTERTFRPRHGADLEEVRAFVDSLEVRRREPPALPAAPEPAPVQVPVKVPEHYREPLERVIEGALVSVETVHRVGTGVVVDVAWEAADEGERRGLYVIEEGEARPFEDLAASVDELPAPRVETPPDADAAASSASPLDAPEEPPAEPAPVEEPAAAAPAESAHAAARREKKKRLLGRFGKKDEAQGEPEPEAGPATGEPAPEAEATKKKRFGFGRKP